MRDKMTQTLYELQQRCGQLNVENAKLKRDSEDLTALRLAHTRLHQKYSTICEAIYAIDDAVKSDKPARHVERAIEEAVERALEVMD